MVPPSVSQMLRSEGIEVKERTESVAFNPDTFQLFAQPQQIRLDTGEVMGSELFIFSDGGGQPIAVQSMPNLSFIAGGMVLSTARACCWDRAIGSTRWTKRGASCCASNSQMPRSTSLALALDTDGDLLVLDRAGRRLLEMRLMTRHPRQQCRGEVRQGAGSARRSGMALALLSPVA